MEVKRGDICYADLNPVIGSEQGGLRPVLIIQNNKGNTHSTTTIVAAITSQKRGKLPTHVSLSSTASNLATDSIIECEQLRTIDKTRIKTKLGRIPDDIMLLVDSALLISLEITRIKEKSNGS